MTLSETLKRQLFIKYVMAMIASYKILEQKNAVTKEAVNAMVDCSLHILSIYNVSSEEFENEKLDMDLDISFPQNI